MKVAVIILNWNGRKLMEKFLPSLLKHTPCETAEIIVADNCSTDGSVKMLQERFPSVRVIVLDRNYGFAEGYNRAIEQVDSDYTVLLNSDVEVTPHWLDAPLDAMDRDTRIAGVQPKILSERNRSFFEYAGASGGWIDRYGYPFCRGRVLGVVEEDQGQYDTTADVFWASGACLFVRTDVYKKEGGLDSRFFAHQEEIDLCWRLRSRGYRLLCTPRSVVYHVGGGTLHVESPHKTFLNFRNNLLMIYKNLPDQDLRRVMRWRFMLDYLAAIRFVLTGHPKNAWAIVRARNVFGQWKHEYAAIRKENLEKTHAYPVPEMMKQSLLLNFYLRGMKKFSDLMQPPSSKF
ncbi:glycosyltransferase family 2 protein [Tannerella forsythia]|uniref:glycosyltransferase family 2 protein n=1 Tax=Tannerella forsythia TaxID=28112 RepID=UPI00242A6B08|nr:glycosyltransferase family 2 protein [Tannerella forsythia]